MNGNAASWSIGRWAPAGARAGALPQAEPDRRWDLLLVCIAGYVFAGVGRVHQVFAVLEPLHLILVFSSLAIVLYFVSYGGRRRLQPVLRLRPTRWVLALVVWAALSVPGALWAGGAFQAFIDFAKIALMSVILAAAVRGVRDVERLAFVYLLSVAFYACVVLARFQIGVGEGADAWRLGSLYYYDANEFATLAVISLPLGVYFLARRRPWWRRLASLGAVVVLGVGIIWAGSRGGFLALLAASGFLLLRYTAIHVRWRLLTAAVLAFAFAATASDKYWDEMKTIIQPKDDYNFTAQEGRVQVWRRGVGYMLEHPVLGVGVGNFVTAEGTNRTLLADARAGRGVKWSEAHNTFIQVGAEVGLPGLALFVSMLAAAFRALRTVRRYGREGQQTGPPPAALAQALTASLIGFLVGGFFLSLAWKDLLLVLVGLVSALRKVTAVAPAPPPQAFPQRRVAWSS